MIFDIGTLNLPVHKAQYMKEKPTYRTLNSRRIIQWKHQKSHFWDQHQPTNIYTPTDLSASLSYMMVNIDYYALNNR